MELEVTDEGKSLAGSEIKVFRNGSLVETVLTDGEVELTFLWIPKVEYMIEVGGIRALSRKKLLLVQTMSLPIQQKATYFTLQK